MDTVLILALDNDIPYVTYIYHEVYVGWSGFADNPDHRILQMTEELLGLCLLHEVRVSKVFISVLIGKRVEDVKDIIYFQYISNKMRR